MRARAQLHIGAAAATVRLGSDRAIVLIFKDYRSKNRYFQALKHHFQGQKHAHKGRLVLGVHTFFKDFISD